MPNHVCNKIQVSGSEKDVKAVDKKVISVVKEGKCKERHFDFNNIVPMPKELGIECSSNKDKEYLKLLASNKKKFGHETWYDWCCDKWGTKWNAYSQDNGDEGSGEYSFQTAWANPFPVLKALSKKFPKVEINVKYADEDVGNNCGEYTLKAGKIAHEKNFATDKDSLRYALEMWGSSPADYGYDKNLERIKD